MKRRLNSTGRRKIPRELFSLRIEEDSDTGDRRLHADLARIKTLNLDPEARVILEPYVKQSSERFDLGPIANLPADLTVELREIDRGAAITFRIRVVDTRESPGRILASADQVRPTDSDQIDDRKSILPLRETDLGETVWRIAVGRDTPPELLVNNRIPGLRKRLDEDVLLQGAIYTQAAAAILRVVFSDNVDDEEEWVQDWRTFAEALLGEELNDTQEDVDDLVERICEAFDQRMQWRTKSSGEDEPEVLEE
jgi:hypothetical protein